MQTLTKKERRHWLTLNSFVNMHLSLKSRTTRINEPNGLKNTISVRTSYEIQGARSGFIRGGAVMAFTR